MSTRLHRKLDEDTFDVGLHGLGGDLQLLGDAFIGKARANRAKNAVFARTQRLRDARGAIAGRARTLPSTVRKNASDRKSTRLNSSHCVTSRMPSSA